MEEEEPPRHHATPGHHAASRRAVCRAERRKTKADLPRRNRCLQLPVAAALSRQASLSGAAQRRASAWTDPAAAGRSAAPRWLAPRGLTGWPPAALEEARTEGKHHARALEPAPQPQSVTLLPAGLLVVGTDAAPGLPSSEAPSICLERPRRQKMEAMDQHGEKEAENKSQNSAEVKICLP